VTSKIDEIMRKSGPPTLMVIYPRGQEWRFALYHSGGVGDGVLPGVPPAADAQTARHAAEAHIGDICRRFYRSGFSIGWDPPDDKGAITGRIQLTPEKTERPGTPGAPA
jgi:hypothetical protein